MIMFKHQVLGLLLIASYPIYAEIITDGTLGSRVNLIALSNLIFIQAKLRLFQELQVLKMSLAV